MEVKELLRERILILDGAMGTMIQRYDLTEQDYRGDLFAGSEILLKGNNDLLCLTRPDVISQIHDAYLQAGADIIETNTFNATSVSMSEYHMQPYVGQINRAAVRLARASADKYTLQTPDKPRFVAGSVGPTNKTCSMSPDVNDPAYRALGFDDLAEAYAEQMTVFLEEGVDLFLIETIFDTLNAKAALLAVDRAMSRAGRRVPVMLSVTLSDSGGRTLSGQTLGAFLASVQQADLLSVGLNCSFGARDMKPFLKQLGQMAPYYISAYPNAGLPNRFGEYDETPDTMASQVDEYIQEQLVNIIGGCCGTTPDHIARYSALIEGASVRRPAAVPDLLNLSGLERFEIRPENNFVNIGERCNVAGSRKFLRLIKERNFEEALEIARKQVEDGAQILDINMDDAMLDARDEMVHFLNLIASEPEICRVPMMVDSSKWPVIEAGLKCIQGKSVVNSISLKEGEAVFLEHARTIQKLGAAMVVMAFDEKGQADSYERKIEICERAYRLLVGTAGVSPNDIIFDPNVLAIATGIDEHLNYGVDFIRATGWIKKNLPGAHVSGGISNLSFSFRGNDYIREAIHAVFLFHAIAGGLDMGIVNPATSVTYNDIPQHILTVIEDVVLNRRPDATEQLIELAEEMKEGPRSGKKESVDERAGMTLDQRLEYALLKGRSDGLETDLPLAVERYGRAVQVIDGPLMSGMNKVGELFGAGKMFLPQVVKTARTMKQAVTILQPYIESEKSNAGDRTTAGKFLLATVKGDVHDIGKNIVSVVLSCNNYEVIDLGVMVPAEEIMRRAIEEKVDFVGLSGLITPSLEEMSHVAAEMEKAGLQVPLMIGGATTSKLHTAVKIAPMYSGPVIHVKDAAQNPVIASQLKNTVTRVEFLSRLQEEQERLRRSIDDNIRLVPYQTALKNRFVPSVTDYRPVRPAWMGIHNAPVMTVKEVRALINWKFFFAAWRVSGPFGEVAEIEGCDHCKAAWLASFPVADRTKAAEALQLYKDANRLLDELDADPNVALRARFGFFPARADEQTLYILSDQGETALPVLRQQIEKPGSDGRYLALSDFILPQDDYIGLFSVTVGEEIERKIEQAKKGDDHYRSLLLQSVADRLAEAATELFHHRVRTTYWGYVPDEVCDLQGLLAERYKGIRPAVGYPSLPDQSLNFLLDQLIDFAEIGVSLTENGAMQPNASVSGLLLAHPESRYFYLGRIDDEQRKRYADSRGFAPEESKKWLSV